MTAHHACRLLLRWGLPIAGIGYLAYLFANSDPARLLEHLQPAALAVAITSAVIYCLAFYLLAISRSEEHTSELQSLMRISYAVFCLKKKKKIQQHHTHTQPTN